jgi:cyclophilin family peptidyl-prolyl cis-trans isomerase
VNRRALFTAALVLGAAHAHAGVLARFQMGVGTIDVELYDQDKPITVENFLTYARSGAWNDTLLHRFVPNFVIQGGSFKLPPNETLFTPTSVQPQAIQTLPPIRNEYSVGRTFSNTQGTIAMARVGGKHNSATASWFFNLENNTNLDTVDGGFTVFGRMIRGTTAFNYFRPPYPPTLRLIPQGGPNDGIPVRTTETGQDPNWFHVRVIPLTLQIARVQGGNQLSWTSVEGLPNVIEFTRVMPPVWEELHRVDGTGAAMTHIDNPGTDGYRQYRLRIIYPN